CYTDVASNDPIASRLRAAAAQWHLTAGRSDHDLAEQIRNDRIDILIDLSGHTAHNRLQAFALKPAPVQATYLGYPNTTGMMQIDYRITDASADPPGKTDAFHTETLVRLPLTAWCFQPQEIAPDVAPL